YPDIHPLSQEISDEVFQAKGDLMKSIQTFLEEFKYIPFGEKPKILLQAWYKFFAIQYAQPEDSNELSQKPLEDLQIIKKELTEFAPILSTKEPEYSLSMGYEHPNTTPETESDEIIKSGVEELVPIPNECEIFSDFNNDDDILSDEDAFEDIEYVEASLPDPEIVSVEEDKVVYHEEEEFDLEEIQDVILREKLLSINRLITNIESLNENSTPDCVLNSSASIPIFEESYNSLSDNFSLEFETFYGHMEETRSDNTTTHAHDSLPEYDSFCFEIEPDQERLINVVKNDIHDDSTNDPLLEEADLFLASDNSIPPGIENFSYDSEGDILFLEELLIDDSIPFPVNESPESDFDNPSIPRPPPEPPDAEFDYQLDAGEKIDRPIFFDDNEDHSVQYKEYLENSFNEIAASNSNQEKEKPPQDFDIRQLIREECCIDVCEEQRQNMENTMLYALNSKLLSINLNSQRLNKEKQEVKNIVEQPAERRTRIIESLQNFRVIHKSSTSLKNTSQISLVHAVAPILSTKEPEYSLSMGYEHPNTTPKTESDEIIKSGVKELVPIPSECEILSDSNNDDDILSDDNAFEDIEYVEASLPNPEIVSIAEENDVYVEEEEVDLKDIFQIQDVILCEKLLSINRLIANIESLNDNPTPDRVLNSSASFPIFEESNNSLSDNFFPEFETFCDHTEETRSGITNTHAHDSLPEYDSFCFEIEPDQKRLTSAVMNDISDDSSIDPLLEEVDLFLDSDNSIPSGIKNLGYDSKWDIHFLEELLIDDSIPFHNNELSNFDHHNDPLFPRPPPEPPNAEFNLELDSKEEISVVMNDNDELECLDPRDEIYVSIDNEDDDYFPFMFFIRISLPYLIYSKVFPFLLSAESEDTIFDPGISVESRWIYPSLIEVSCVQFYYPGSQELHILCLRLVWGNLYP
nr:hypothetical protein [Tanacetum cinerariifolium]